MANELTITNSLAFAKGTTPTNIGTVQMASADDITAVDVAGIRVQRGVQLVGAAAADVNYGDIPAADVGYMKAKNLHATQTVKFLVTGGTAFAKLKTGEVCSFRIEPGAQIRAIGSGASTPFEYVIVEK